MRIRKVNAMFFNPSISTNLTPLPADRLEGFQEVYSDLHKDAYGCRPRHAAPTCPMGAAISLDGMNKWSAEGERIAKLAEEVARFNFSQRMNYLLARGECETALEAFEMTVRRGCMRPYPNDNLPAWAEVMETVRFYGWAFVAMDLGMDQNTGKELEAMWKGLGGE